MNYVDLILLLPIVYGLVRGFIKGLVNEVASLLSIVAGLYLAYHYHDAVEQFLASQFGENDSWLGIASYLVIFIAVTILVFLLAKILTRMINFIALGIFNRIAGAVFGAAKVALVFLLLIYLLSPFFDQFIKDNETWSQSVVYDLMTQYASKVGDWITGIGRNEQASPTPA